MIKSRISLFLINLSVAAVTILEAIALSKPALSENCPPYNSTVVQGSGSVQAFIGVKPRYGRILIKVPQKNVTIRLYSPLFPNSIYATWSLSAGESYLSHNGEPLIVAGNWGIQIYDNQGGYSSCIYPVARVGIAPGERTFIGGGSTFTVSGTSSSYNGPDWVVNVENIWQGKKPKPESAPW